ncbi:phosphoribosylpyrophosphate synthetase [Marinilabilia sp.]|uniref:phosphoribosylpyrophosphate synthetase n=1 Tax=Marinilabilia sp. TaxID=2021252 RepID=UPI0025C06286|nr:phosphoribosylpyrophosphate synthetase [Marinilabilia sp.]
METLSEAINALIKKGFTENFRATEEYIEALNSKKRFEPADLKILETYRFEGPTDPADEMICFAIEANDGIKGTLVMSYSSEHSQSIETIRKIPNKK